MNNAKFLLILICGVFLITFSRCDRRYDYPTPKSCFSISGDYVNMEQMNFTNCSNSGYRYVWDFGDGVTSNHVNPIHFYATSGNYTVTLSTYNENEEVDISSQSIFIADKTPTEMIITEITVLNWPPTNHGSPWDSTDQPDIYPTIELNNTIWYKSWAPHENCTIGNSYTFDTSTGLPLYISDLNERFSLNIYDFDADGADELMGGLKFTPFVHYKADVETLNLEAGSYVFRIKVSWVY